MDNEYESSGKITTSKTILFSIVSLATKEISGVVGFSKKTGSFLTSASKKKDFEGILISNNQNGLTIDVFIDVYSNTSAPDICFKVQESIRNSIFNMLTAKVEKINVHIMYVVVKKEVEENESAI